MHTIINSFISVEMAFRRRKPVLKAIISMSVAIQYFLKKNFT